MNKTALLALEDGTLFYGRSIGAEGSATADVVFNTAMTGYQEIITNPSCHRQIVAFTYPHIGNVGVNAIDAESAHIQLSGMIVRDLPRRFSNFRATLDLGTYLKQQGIVGISDIDTRKLTRLLRSKGTLRGTIQTAPFDEQAAIRAAQSLPKTAEQDSVSEVTVASTFNWLRGSWNLAMQHRDSEDIVPADVHYHVVVYDYGVRESLLRMLVDRHCELTIVPASTSADEVMKLNPDGVFLSNGPGDPASHPYASETIRTLTHAEIPIFGVGLGHQLFGVAFGAQTEQLKTGSHGCNHPVIDLISRKVMITTQNYDFAIVRDSLPEQLIETHRSLFDHSVQGLCHATRPIFSFQGHPDTSTGPKEVAKFFERFVELMRSYKANKPSK